MNVIADVTPASTGDTLPLCLAPLMESLNRPDWTVEKIEGVLGHAFHFEMAEGGKHVMHDNIDWGPALDILPRLADFKVFDAQGDDENLSAVKSQARDAVLRGLEKGYAALVWQPMSKEMEAGHHHGFCWGLIVGYNEAEETYTIRHPYERGTYAIRYDALGHTGAEWFNVRVVDRPNEEDERPTHVAALRNAVAFAHQTRFAPDDRRNAKRRARPHGFHAYEVWCRAFGSDEVPLEPSRHHAEVLKGRRRAAAIYLRGLVELFPEAAEPLDGAAAKYDQELESLNPLYDLCEAAKTREAWTNEDRTKAGALVGDALEADREAVALIEAARARLDAS